MDSSEKGGAWRKWFAAENLFAAGLFCLFLAMFLGAKFIAAGQVLAFLAIAIGLAQNGRAGLDPRGLRPSAIWLAVFAVVSAVSILANLSVVADPLAHLGKLRHFLLVLLVLAMPGLVGGYLEVPWRRTSLVLAWLVPLALALILGAITLATGSHPLRGSDVADLDRISGFYGQVMTFANSLQFTVLVLAAFVLAPEKWRRLTGLPQWVAVLAAFAAAAGLYFTYTRGAVLGVAIGLLVYAGMRSRRFLVGVLVLGLLVGGFAALEGERYFRNDASTSIRLNQWKAAALAAVERPVFGWGFRNYELQSSELKKRYGFEKERSWRQGKRQEPAHLQRHAHNNYLEAFASTGVLGGVAFIAFCASWLREARRSRHALFFVPAIVAFFVSGLFENTFFDSEVLNCILLLYLVTQWSLAREAGGTGWGIEGETDL